MKLIMTLTIVLSSALALANGFELIKDGTTYSCIEKTTPNPTAVVACVGAAQGNIGGWLTKDQAVQVCQGAKNNAPANCAGAAQSNIGGWLTKDQAAQVCRGTNSNAPANCAGAAQSNIGGWLTKDQAAELCYGAKDNSPADCAGAAQGNQGGWLSKDEAVKLCKSGNVFSVGGVDFVEKFEPIKSLELFKHKFNLFN